MKNKAISNIQIDNKLVKVTKYSFMPGQETGMHKHLYDYIVTPITNGKLLLIDKNGKERDFSLIASQSYFRKAGVPTFLKKVKESNVPEWLSRSEPDEDKLETIPEDERYGA